MGHMSVRYGLYPDFVVFLLGLHGYMENFEPFSSGEIVLNFPKFAISNLFTTLE